MLSEMQTTSIFDSRRRGSKMAEAPMSVYVQSSATSHERKGSPMMRSCAGELDTIREGWPQLSLNDTIASAAPEDTKKKSSTKAKGKMEIKRIEKTASRQVTFCKRRSGLLKKAFELSVLCESHLALIIFSATDKLYEFASPNMKSVLDQYERRVTLSQSGGNKIEELEYWRLEGNKFKAKVVEMEKMQSYLMGESLMGFQMKDLQRIETQILSGMTRIRERKMQLLKDEVECLSKKEHLLLEENKLLISKMQLLIDEVDCLRKKEHLLFEDNKLLISKLEEQVSSQVKTTRERGIPHHSHQEFLEREKRVVSCETNLQLGFTYGG